VLSSTPFRCVWVVSSQESEQSAGACLLLGPVETRNNALCAGSVLGCERAGETHRRVRRKRTQVEINEQGEERGRWPPKCGDKGPESVKYKSRKEPCSKGNSPCTYLAK